MKLSTLFKRSSIDYVIENDFKVKGISDDSRKIGPDYVFVAITNRKEYQIEAISRGARVIIYQDKLVDELGNSFGVKVYDSKTTYARLLHSFYSKKIKKLRLIGVTGTNGKTTISRLLYNFFSFLHKRSMFIGTGVVAYKNNEIEEKNTTKNIGVLYKYLLLARRKRIRFIFMEVSSIGIWEGRINYLRFERMIFTNLGLDHLDFHGSIDHYFMTKLIPFARLRKNEISIINRDDNTFTGLYRQCFGKCISYGVHKNADFQGLDIVLDIDKTSFHLRNEIITMKLLGEFNVYNTIASYALCYSYGIDLVKFKNFMKDYDDFYGRMQRYSYKGASIIIDYAHTADAVLKVLCYLKRVSKGRVIIILGCGGNRDRSKRRAIGEILERYADVIILTNDNPRLEDEEQIVSDISAGISKKFYVEYNRKEAINLGLEMLKKDDCIGILGKGVERNIDYGTKIVLHSDPEYVLEWINNHE